MAQESKGEPRTVVDIAYMYGTPLVYQSSAGAWMPVSLLDVTSDVETVRQAITRSKRSFVWQRCVATRSSLIDVVSRGCRILHFTGHGSNSGFVSGLQSPQHTASRPSLAFEDAQTGALDYLDADVLTRCLSNRESHDERVMLVVIMACESAGVAKALVERGGCSHAIAINAEKTVSDKDAMAFMEKFYEQFLSGRSITYSFNAALINVGTGRKSDEGQFLLFDAADADPWNSKMPLQPEGIPRDVSIRGVDTSFDGPPHFRGRRQDLFEITRAFFGNTHKRKFVQIVGDAGMGKSSLAARFVRRVQQRHPWDVLWVDLHGVEQTVIVVQRIIKALRNTYTTYYDDLPEDTKVEANVNTAIDNVYRSMANHMWVQAPQALLLVLDGVEPSLADLPALRHLITRMLEVHNSSLRLLITARKSVSEIVASFSHTVKGLGREDSAYLMSSIKPHENIQINGVGDGVAHVWNSLKDTKGNPGIIAVLSLKISTGANLNDVVQRHLKDAEADVLAGKFRFRRYVAPLDFRERPRETPRETPGKPVSPTFHDNSIWDRTDTDVPWPPDAEYSSELYDVTPSFGKPIHQDWIIWQIERPQAERLLNEFSFGDCLIRQSKHHTTVSVKEQERYFHFKLQPTQNDLESSQTYVAQVGNNQTQDFATPEAFVEWHQKCRRIVVPLSDNKHPSHGAPLSKHMSKLLHRALTRREAEDVLGKHKKEGTFLLRLSRNKANAVVVSCWVARETELKVQHFDVKYSGKWQLPLRDAQGRDSVEHYEDLAECIGPNLEWKRAVLVTGRVVEKSELPDLQDFVSEHKYDSVPIPISSSDSSNIASPPSRDGAAASRASTDSINSVRSPSGGQRIGVSQSASGIYSPIG